MIVLKYVLQLAFAWKTFLALSRFVTWYWNKGFLRLMQSLVLSANKIWFRIWVQVILWMKLSSFPWFSFYTTPVLLSRYTLFQFLLTFPLTIFVTWLWCMSISGSCLHFPPVYSIQFVFHVLMGWIHEIFKMQNTLNELLFVDVGWLMRTSQSWRGPVVLNLLVSSVQNMVSERAKIGNINVCNVVDHWAKCEGDVVCKWVKFLLTAAYKYL